MYGLTKSHLPCDTCHTLPTVPVIPLTCNFQYPYPCVITYSSEMSPLLKWKPICPLAYVKSKTSSSHFLKICFRKGAATFLNPFKIGAAAFLAFYWYRCGCFLRGKLALAKGQPLFWDPFKIQPAMFLEINISKGAAAFFGSLCNRAGHVFGNYISKMVATFLGSLWNRGSHFFWN